MEMFDNKNRIYIENKLYIVKKYEYDNPIIENIDFLIFESLEDCFYNYYHTFEYECIYDINFTNNTNLTISGKSLCFFELNKKLNLLEKRGYKFNYINNLKIHIYSNLIFINIHYILSTGAPVLYYKFFKNLLKNRNYIETHCNNINNPSHFACLKWHQRYYFRE